MARNEAKESKQRWDRRIKNMETILLACGKDMGEEYIASIPALAEAISRYVIVIEVPILKEENGEDD